MFVPQPSRFDERTVKLRRIYETAGGEKVSAGEKD